MNANVWIAPASTKNLNTSIINKIVTPTGPKHAWAMNERHVRKFAKLAVGDIVLFGNASLGYRWFATVTEKPMDVAGIEWPYQSPSGAPWSNVFYVDEPQEIAVALTPENIRNILNVGATQMSQYALEPPAAVTVLEHICNNI
jgi:hypothetical protein